MPKFRNVVNDGTNNAPRLRMQYNMWALIGLPRGGAEWTIDQRLDKVCQAGFTGFEASASTGRGKGVRSRFVNLENIVPIDP